MQHRSDQHGPRRDDALRHDVQSLLQGEPHEARSQPQRLQEEDESAPALSPNQTFHHFEEVWEALGGATEARPDQG